MKEEKDFIIRGKNCNMVQVCVSKKLTLEDIENRVKALPKCGGMGEFEFEGCKQCGNQDRVDMVFKKVIRVGSN